MAYSNKWSENDVDVASLRQRLFRLFHSAESLSQSTIKILERISLHRALPDSEDVADLTDRLHDIFQDYSHLTRSAKWQIVDDNEQD